MAVNILDCKVDNVDMADAISIIEGYIADKKVPRHVITLNAEIIYRALSEPQLKELINNADLVTPDGAGVVWAAKYLKAPVKERVTGIDLLQALAEIAPYKKWKLYFYGGAQGVAEEAKDKLKAKYPDIDIVGVRHGFLSPKELEEMLMDIREKKPDILFVALGAPRQEFWIQEFKEILGVPVSIGIGGSFDVIAGKAKRAPKVMQDLKLEWLYRLMKEPWRYKRMLALPKFVVQVVRKGKKTVD